MNKQTHKRWQITTWGIVVSILAILGPVSGAQIDGWFITPEEAAMAPAADTDPLQGGDQFEIGRDDLNLGPKIEVEKPLAGSPHNSPLEIVVNFSPGAFPIDLNTLEVGLVKFFTIDITDRVVDYTTKEGIRLSDANIPSGSHRVRISLADTTGAVSTKDFLFEVL